MTFFGLFLLLWVPGNCESALVLDELSWTVPKTNGTIITHLGFSSLYYYVSPILANWEAAVETCMDIMHPTASLISIETEDEWKFVDIFLKGYPTGYYWTSGMANPSSQPFPYSWVNGRPIAEWAPWVNGTPPAVHFPFQRLAIHHSFQQNDTWDVHQNSKNHFFICEYPDPTQPLPCYSANDLLLIIDSSGSVTQPHFRTALKFVDNLAGAFMFTNESRIGLIKFDTNVDTIFQLTTPNDPKEMHNKIKATPYTAGGTNTHLAIDAAVKMYQDLDRSVPKNVVVLTDGQSNDPTATKEASKKASEAGLIVYSVGIGNGVDHEELRLIAGGDLKKVFTTDEFSKLVQLLRPVSEIVCPEM